MWGKATIFKIAQDSASAPPTKQAMCLALDLTKYPGDVVLYGLPSESWDTIKTLDFIQTFVDVAVFIGGSRLGMGFSHDANLVADIPANQFFDGERFFKYQTSGLNFWLQTTIQKDFFEWGVKVLGKKFGIAADMTITGYAGLSVTHPFSSLDGYWEDPWEGYIHGDVDLYMKLTIASKEMTWHFNAKGAALASLDGSSGTPLQDRCSPSSNPKGVFIYTQVDFSVAKFGTSFLDNYLGRFIGLGMDFHIKPIYLHLAYLSEKQSDGSWEEGLAGLGVRYEANVQFCIFPGLCLNVKYIDITVADIATMGRCDTMEEVYRDFPGTYAVSVRGQAYPNILGGFVTLPTDAQARLVVSVTTLAALGQLKVRAAMWGISVEANLMAGTHPTPFVRLNFYIDLFSLFRAEVDIAARLPPWNDRTLLDWFTVDYTLRLRMTGDLQEAIMHGVEKLIRYLADSINARIKDAKDSVDGMKSTLQGVLDNMDKAREDLRKAQAKVDEAKAVCVWWRDKKWDEGKKNFFALSSRFSCNTIPIFLFTSLAETRRRQG